MTKKQKQKLKEQLEKERKTIREQLETFAKEDKKPSGDWDTRYPKLNGSNLEEAADEVGEYDKLLSIEYSLELRLKDIKKALNKIEKGNYGICEGCGKKISPKRLGVCPEARTCINCRVPA